MNESDPFPNLRFALVAKSFLFAEKMKSEEVALYSVELLTNAITPLSSNDPFTKELLNKLKEKSQDKIFFLVSAPLPLFLTIPKLNHPICYGCADSSGLLKSKKTTSSVILFECSTPANVKIGSKLCRGCYVASYCSEACQKKDWPKHKERCKAYSTVCSVCSKETTKRCSCKVRFCSESCQRLAWFYHKKRHEKKEAN